MYNLQFILGDMYSVCVLVTQSCSTLCGTMDYSQPGSSVHGVLQVRKLEWVAISFSSVIYGFGQMYYHMNPSLLYHTGYFHCLKKSSVFYSSLLPCTQYHISKPGKGYQFLSKLFSLHPTNLDM